MKTRRTLLLTLLGTALPLVAHAFSVNPMSVEFDPDQPNAQQLFVLNNSADKDVPVEVRVARPVVDDNGVETLEMGAGEDAFIVLPQQLILPAGGRRSVKVNYVGDNDGTEQTYRIIFCQLPVDLPAEAQPADPDRPTFNMQVVMQYHTRIWITPKGLKENLAVKRFAGSEAVIAPSVHSIDGTETTATESRLQPVLEVVIANTGSKHAYLLAPKLLAVSNSGPEIALPEAMLKPLLGQVVLAGRERAFQLPAVDGLPAADDIRELRLILEKP